MKIFIKAMGIALFACLLTACSDNFLEESPNGYISVGQLEENARWNPDILLGQAAGIISTSFASESGGSSGSHADFGQKAVDIATDLMSGDVVMGGLSYGWFGNDARLLNNTKDRTERSYSFWRYYYRIIKAANTIFDTVGGDGNMPEEGTDNRNYYGQAKVLRAYAYFNLVNLYARPYEVSKDVKALPIYTSQVSAVTSVLSTVDEIYKFLIDDLKEAIVALTDMERSNKTAPDVNVAKCFLAYAYLSKGDYALAAQTAQEVIDSEEYYILQLDEITTTGFNSLDNHTFVWGIDLTKDNTPALPTFWGHFDYFTYSYCAVGDYKEISDTVYYRIPETDARKGWFRPSKPFLGWWKFYDANRTSMGDRLWENDEVYMRIEEMYLIAAEANLRAGNATAAKAVLGELLEQRDPTVAAELGGMSNDDLLELLYYNWQVELWGEGRGLLTLKRFKKQVIRGTNDVTLPQEMYNYDDSRLYIEIPENELLNNPNIN